MFKKVIEYMDVFVFHVIQLDISYQVDRYICVVCVSSSAFFFTHSDYQARTIKILQSLCASHKIMETYRNQHAPKFSKGKMGMVCQWQH
jgi:hypothetical protein